MNRADFIAAIVAAQDSAATTPRVAADQTSVRDVAAHLAARPQGTPRDAEDSRSSGSLGTSRPRTAAHKPATKEQQR